MAAIPLTRSGPSDGGNFEYHWTGPYGEAHLLSDVGKKRKHNEDSCAMCVPDDETLIDERGMIFAVADGMGGANAGEFASRLALETFVEGYYSNPCGNIPKCASDAIELANTRIFEEAENNPEYRGMGTTVSALLVHGECAYVAQVGDSRIYLLRKDTDIQQITDDHSLVAEQVRHGYLSEEEARNHSLKNLITRAVGIKVSVKIDLFAFRLQQDDTILLCSDGLSNLVRDDEVAQILRKNSIQAASRLLVGRALEEGGTDNITVVVLRTTSPLPKSEFHTGVTEISFGKQSFFKRLAGFLFG